MDGIEMPHHYVPGHMNSCLELFLVIHGTIFSPFSQYNGWYRDAPSLRAWAYEFLPSKTHDLSWETFTSDVLQVCSSAKGHSEKC